MQQKKRRETSSDKQAVRRTTCGWLLIVASSLACAGAGAQATGAQSVAVGAIVGTVYDSLRTGAPLANATVVLVERARYATTDARGRFHLDSIPEGQYTIGFGHVVLDSLDLELPVVAVTVAGGRRTSVALTTPSPHTLYTRLCPDSRETDVGVIVGRVRDVDSGAPFIGATVSTDWAEYSYSARGTTRERVRAIATTDRAGLFRLCAVPTDVPVNVVAARDSSARSPRAGPLPRVLDEHLLGRADFAISQHDVAATQLFRTDTLGTDSVRADTAIGATVTENSVTANSASTMRTARDTLRGTASLRGVVRTPDGRAARDAQLLVLGTSRSTRTDSAGAFALERIPAGTRTIEIRAIGLAPTTVSVDFQTDAIRDTTIALRRPPPTLAKVAVKAAAGSGSLMKRDGFDTRRRQGLGAFLSGEALDHVRTTQLATTLGSLRGVHVDGGTMPMLRGMKGPTCIPNYFVDGIAFYVDGEIASSKVRHPFTDLTDAIPAERIRGIEVYASGGTIPIQFDLTSSTGCGSIVIWTR